MNKTLRFHCTFEADPDSGHRAHPDLSASWGSFELWVGDVNLCRHVAGSQVQHRTTWYLLPLLEWLVTNWDRFFHESRIPEGLIQDSSARASWLASEPYALLGERAAWAESWWASHAFRASAQGGIFPDVFLRRYRDDLEVSWGSAAVSGAPDDLRFLAASGRSVSPVEHAAAQLHQSLGGTIEQLLALLPSSRISHLATKHAALLLPSPQRAQWVTGWSSLNVWKENILHSFSGKLGSLVLPHVPPPLALFGSLSPSVSESDVAAVHSLLSSAETTVGPALPSLYSPQSSSDSWEQGYEMAEITRRRLQLDETQLPVLGDVLGNLGIAERKLALSDSHIRAIALCGGQFAPTIAVNTNCPTNSTDPGYRFTLSHELCHLLFDREVGVPLAVASGPWAPKEIEQRANAFAAMFLMPVSACRRAVDQYVGQNAWTPEALRDIAQEFGTGRVATLKHLRNLRLIDAEDADSL